MSAFLTKAAVYTDKGLVRLQNQDSYFLNGTVMPVSGQMESVRFMQAYRDECQMFAVCDGMGGEQHGELASATAVEGLQGLYQRLKDVFDSDLALQQEVKQLNRNVVDALSGKEFGGGTTLVAVLICNGYYRTLHVGDSRAYLLRENHLVQLTKDHSEVQRMVDMGVLTEEQMETHLRKNVITRYLGIPETEGDVQATISSPQPLKTDDRFLLCSDGVCGVVRNPELKELMSAEQSVGALADSIAQQALTNKTRDNLTSMVVQVNAADKGTKTSSRSANIPNKGKRIMLLILCVMVLLSGYVVLFKIVTGRENKMELPAEELKLEETVSIEAEQPIPEVIELESESESESESLNVQTEEKYYLPTENP